jgi:LPXTG-site transpeptidase (sortase) family protein
MDHNNNHKSGQFDASLQLPDDAKKKSDSQPNPAADLVRKKVDAAYAHEPDTQKEIEEVQDIKPGAHRSKHQQFIYELTSSGRPLHEVQTAWHEYYAGLTDADKHQVWQEFYNAHSQAAHHPALSHTPAKTEPVKALIKKAARKLPRQRTEIHQAVHRRANPIHSLLFGVGIGSITILIFLFSFFNDRIIAPFIQPSRNVSNIPILSGAPVGTSPEVIIPKINAEVPVVYDVPTIDDSAIQEGLTRGVVHYADTALPGQDGNVVIVGHSSGNIFNLGKYKFAFSLLRVLDNGDTFFLQKDGKRYVYQVYEKRVVSPTDVSVLGPADRPATATLITCDPPGLSTNRLVITAVQISPDPAANTAQTAPYALAKKAIIVPGNSISLWARLVKWFKN